MAVHVPPGVGLDSVVDKPVHTVVAPIIAAGSGLTETVAVVRQPVVGVYVIIVVPTDTLLNTPELVSISAIDVLLLVQVPPGMSCNVEVAPRQTEKLPVIGGGPGFTVIVCVMVLTHPEPFATLSETG